MIKKIAFIIINLFAILSITGCWDYVGLNEMTVVAGIAIDKIDDEYAISFEIYNLKKTSTGDSIKSTIVESKGSNIFDAVRNGKKKVANKLYFSDTKIIIVSKKIAMEDGINSIISWFNKDPEIRENLELVISEEKTAAELLKIKGLTDTIVSNDIKKIVEKDQKITGTTESSAIYNIYNTINAVGVSLTLPSIHVVKNNEEMTCEINGIAIFKEDKLINFLSAEDTKYYLIAKGNFNGGIITINTKIKAKDSNKQNISLEVKHNETSQKYISFENNNLKIKISSLTTVSLGEFIDQQEKLTNEDIKNIQKNAEEVIKERITAVIKKIQFEYKTDILGLENLLYRTNHKIWKKLRTNSELNIEDIKIEIEANVKIINTGFSK